MNPNVIIVQQWQRGRESGWSSTHLMNGTVPILAPAPAPRYPEAYIDYWYDIYASNRLYEQRGIRFDVFLSDPCGIISALLWSRHALCAEEFRPLLPRQQHIADTLTKIDALQAEAERLEAELDAKRPALQRRNGGWYEPLKHHLRARGPRVVPA